MGRVSKPKRGCVCSSVSIARRTMLTEPASACRSCARSPAGKASRLRSSRERAVLASSPPSRCDYGRRRFDASPNQGKPMKLLLVEDDADLARWVMNLMQVENFAIDWAQDGERAETLLGLQCYDAVLLDLRLPGIGGKDVLARLRRKRDNVPVLMLTANGSTDDKVACFSAGADD